MKKLATISKFSVLLTLSGVLVFTTSCKKNSPCEDKNTFTLTVKNMALSGVLNFNVDKDFAGINSPGDYKVAPGETLSIDLSSGSHTIKAKNIRTSCTNGNCSTTVTGQPGKTVNQGSCQEAVLVY